MTAKRTVIASTDCPLCRHPSIEHEIDPDLDGVRECQVPGCSCKGYTRKGAAR